MKFDDLKRKWKFDNFDMRLFATCFGGGVLLAVMTGPEGDLTTPGYTIIHSLFSSHVWGFLIFGVLLGLAQVYGRKVRAGIFEASWASALRRFPKTLKQFIAFAGLLRQMIIGVIAVIIALFVSDFTGPLVHNKLSWNQLIGQLLHTRTYGYIAIVIWVLNTIRVAARHNPDEPEAPSFFDAKWFKIVAGGVGGLFFAACADPWMPVRFSIKYFDFKGSSDNNFFHHWTTYAWIIVGLLIGLRAAFLERERSKSRGALASRWRARHVKVSANTRFALYGAALFVAIEAPKFLSPYWQESIFQQIGVFCLLAVGLNVVVGFAGLLDLGYVAFYAFGAYTNAYFSGALPIHPPFTINTFFVVPIAILVAMFVGVLLGLPTLRLRGDYLAIVTLGFGEIVYVLASNLTGVTDGAGGTGVTGSFSMNLPGIHFALSGFALGDDLNFYYLFLAFLIPILFFFNSLNHSKVGRSWAAIREDEVAAGSLGINSLKYKVMAFAIGASTSGVAGVLSSAKLGSLFPSNFALQVSITVLVLVIFGGMGSIGGVLIGSAILNWVLIYLQFHSFIDYQLADKYMYLGALLVLVMIFRPQGMFPSKRRLREFQDSEQGLGSADAMTNPDAARWRVESYGEGRGYQEPEPGMGNPGARLE
jgi:branched-chain amino acid transport system permease protein